MEYSPVENIFLALGIAYGLKLQEKFRVESDDWQTAEDFEVLNGGDLGLTGKFKVAYRNFFGFARFNLGLGSVADWQLVDENAQLIGTTSLRRRSLQIGLGYQFQL